MKQKGAQRNEYIDSVENLDDPGYDDARGGKSLKINLQKARMKDAGAETTYGSLFGGSKRQEKHHSENSCNSLPFEPDEIRSLISKKIKEINMPMPPTKVGLRKLFDILNLDVSPVKLLDCMLMCRGKKMEASIEPEDYDCTKLVNWFVLNIRTLKHKDTRSID